jgi:hypothetical protein
MAVVGDVIEIKELCDFAEDIADWYVDVYPMSYTAVIKKVITETKLIKEPEKAALIMGIINQNFGLYASDGLITKEDDDIIRGGYEKFRSDMFCTSND